MKTYCLKCKKDTENIDSKIVQSECSDCKNKKSRFARGKEAKDLLSNLGIKTPLSKILLLNVLF